MLGSEAEGEQMMITTENMLSASNIHALPLRERVGLVLNGSNAKNAIRAIIDAENAGMRQIWSTQTPTTVDILSVFTVAAGQTSTIRMGTSIFPIYPRHPLAMVVQVHAFYELAPGRLRLGVGPSHRPTIEGMYGLPMVAPLAHMREYISVLRAALWAGKVEHQGRFYNISASLPYRAEVPILNSALGTGAFLAAGELSDGAISWSCPVPYLLKTALPALEEGAIKAGRSAPPVIAHVPIAHSTDRQAVLDSAQKQIGSFGQLPFYRNMFIEAGYDIPENGALPKALLDDLVVSGDEQTIATRLRVLLSTSLSELMLQPIPVNDEAHEWSQLTHLLGSL
jgi:alkanesulfonate monooxygenase SsuD/methylene tetrahydromethanopterin reductase-like flavin-dependent oxidoreductase (luciferase family)